MSTVLRRIEAELSMKKHEAKQKIWTSPFAKRIYEEIMKDSPTYIGFESGWICWGNNYNGRPEKTIRFSERGYNGLSSLEIEALMDLFVRKSENYYSKFYDEDNYFWPYYILRVYDCCRKSLSDW